MDGIRGHGIHNGLYVCACNRVGREDAGDGSGGYMTFYGRSFAADPWGRVVAEAARDEEDVLLATLDLSEVRRARDILQFHRDRRTDTYGEILERSIG